MASTNVLAFVGSLGSRSVNRLALIAAQQLAPAGMQISLVDLAPIPFYNPDDEVAERLPAAVHSLRTQVAAADGLLFATAEYNHTVPAVLTNMMDWLSRSSPPPFAGKPAAMFGAASGQTGTARAQMHLLVIARSLGLLVMPQPELYIREAQSKFDAAGRLSDAQTEAELRAFLAAFDRWLRRLLLGADRA